jgi:hypothetical protein
VTLARHPARDPGTRLAAAILAHGAAAGCAPDLVSLDQQEWASATFIGLRQRLVLAAPPGAIRTAWLASLADAAFPIPRHILADLAVLDDGADARRITIETLLLLDG